MPSTTILPLALWTLSTLPRLPLSSPVITWTVSPFLMCMALYPSRESFQSDQDCLRIQTTEPFDYPRRRVGLVWRAGISGQRSYIYLEPAPPRWRPGEVSG